MIEKILDKEVEKTLRIVFEEMDENNDGVIELEELTKMF